MKFKIPLLSLIVGAIAMSIVSLAVFSSEAATPRSKANPKYLLSGSLVTSYEDETYDYYDIGNNELAIALKDGIEEQPTTITIPSTYDGKDVTGIWHNAFHECSATSITFQSPSNIRTIDYEAFFFSKITSITIPYTIDEIGDAAFYSCTDLTSVTIVNSSAESTGSALSCYCEEDEPVTPDPEQDEGDEEDFDSCDLRVIPTYCFFRCSSLVDLTLPSSIRDIREEAFNGCSALHSDLFFREIEHIGERAFQGCTSLGKVYISKTLFADVDNPGIEKHAFNYCDPTLNIFFCGIEDEVTAWVNAHPLWGWHTDYTDPNATSDTGKKINSYDYILQTGDNYFTSDWMYTYDALTKEVTITKYIGDAPTESKNGAFISIPSRMDFPAGNKVTKIAVTAFEGIESTIKRIYLPTTLKSIDNRMFKNGYTKLHVIDDNTSCEIDKGNANNKGELSVGRIDLSGLKDLEFIGVHAFTGFGDAKSAGVMYRNRIRSINLPSGLVSVGDEAFGVFGQRYLPNVKEFTWEYDEDNAKLETVGTDAFYALGYSSGTGEIKGNEARKAHSASTIIFPKMFKYFGLLDSDVDRYKTPPEGAKYSPFIFDVTTDAASRRDRPAHAFSGCSLLGKVVFKGSMDPNDTTDLIIPLQTFVYNESLHTIIFEERKDHRILFHTQCPGRHYAQESIGGNSGRGSNDFRAEPFLQTLVLPNKYTSLHMQDFALHANARAVLYLSSTLGNNMYRDATNQYWIQAPTTFGTEPLASAVQWRTIGNEDWYPSNNQPGYYGYVFAESATSKESAPNKLGTYGLNQEMPVYENVHYYDEETGAEVGEGNTREFTTSNKCAFICEEVGNEKVATMTKYLYNLFEGTDSNATVPPSDASLKTATIPETVTVDGVNYTVRTVGESAFSACYCDGTDIKKNIGQFYDLNTIVLPNTIKEIGDYAFIRAYGVTTIKSYSGSATPVEGMPSSLRKIGKNAFIFCGIEQVLNIPNECLFYENYESTQDVTKATSVFSNAVSLRKITFVNGSGQGGQTSSKYYTTTTYTSESNGERTCAIYSTNDSGIAKNKNRLLLVLNRDGVDNYKTNTADYTIDESRTYPVFNGNYKTNPFLYGAFKMGYFIYELNCGTATKDGSGNIYAQPLFSGVGDRTGNELTTKVLYLGVAGYNYYSLKCDLTAIAGNVFSLPEYGMNECENLTTINLPYKSGGKIPDGVFANYNKTNRQYNTLNSSGAIAHSEANTLDLRDSGYAELGKESFMNNASIYKFTAPDVATFKVGNSTFKNCDNLTTVDLSNVTATLTLNTSSFQGCDTLSSVTFGSQTGTVTIGESAFQSCPMLTTLDFSDITGTLIISKYAFKDCDGLTNIIWPTSGTVKLESEGAFEDCDNLVNATLPQTMTATLGKKTFYSCNSLASVSAAASVTNLTTIGESAFEDCTNLNDVDFSVMPALTTINKYAFKNTGTLADDGVLNIPGTIRTIDMAAFQKARMSVVNFSANVAGAQLMLGNTGKDNNALIFDNCDNLTAIRFVNDNYTIKYGSQTNKYNGPQFSNCDVLNELLLPSSFNVNCANISSLMNGSPNIRIFVRVKWTKQAYSLKWREVGGVTKPIHYQVESLNDLNGYDIDISAGTKVADSQYYWTYNGSGSVVALGQITSFTGGVVTFTNGTTLDSTGFSNLS